MLFLNLIIYQNKSKLNYVDLHNILQLTINSRNSWNFNTLKTSTCYICTQFKDKLTEDQYIILRANIVELRKLFKNKLVEEHTTWLSASKTFSLLNFLSPFFLQYPKRQVILNRTRSNTLNLFNTAEPSAL